MKAMDEYEAARKAVFDYFGYVEQWRVFPIDDQRRQHWMVVGGESDGAVVYSPEPFTDASLEAGKAIYSGSIYTQRHLDKWVWRGREYTMALVDTQCDGNVVLMVFANALECTDERLKETYRETWG
jgi:hypothetical protein